LFSLDFVTRLLQFLLVAVICGHAQGATYRGRVQYVSTGKPAAKVLVEARSRSGLNLLFLVPQVPYTVVRTVTTRSDGTFIIELPEPVRRLRFAARGKCTRSGTTRWDREISPRPNAPNIIIVPADFQPWHPRKKI
jgi:hypothetical protein